MIPQRHTKLVLGSDYFFYADNTTHNKCIVNNSGFSWTGNKSFNRSITGMDLFITTDTGTGVGSRLKTICLAIMITIPIGICSMAVELKLAWHEILRCILGFVEYQLILVRPHMNFLVLVIWDYWDKTMFDAHPGSLSNSLLIRGSITWNISTGISSKEPWHSIGIAGEILAYSPFVGSRASRLLYR